MLHAANEPRFGSWLISQLRIEASWRGWGGGGGDGQISCINVPAVDRCRAANWGRERGTSVRGGGWRLPNIDSATVRGICQAYLRACVGNKHLMSLTNNVDSPTIHYTSRYTVDILGRVGSGFMALVSSARKC